MFRRRSLAPCLHMAVESAKQGTPSLTSTSMTVVQQDFEEKTRSFINRTTEIFYFKGE
jgi:hypothetical protein